jgi:hypothetical protein
MLLLRMPATFFLQQSRASVAEEAEEKTEEVVAARGAFWSVPQTFLMVNTSTSS